MSTNSIQRIPAQSDFVAAETFGAPGNQGHRKPVELAESLGTQTETLKDPYTGRRPPALLPLPLLRVGSTS